MSERRLRFGILGAARIAPMALLRPARAVPDAEVVAVAARDPARARAFARKHGIPEVAASYEELIRSPEIDAVYIPLPNGLHGRWAMAALEAGKDVLCEKPLAANAEEAERMVETARRTGRRLVEAFHWRYHPLARRTEADLSFPDGRSGRILCSLLSARILDIRARVVGERGRLDVLNPVVPQFFHRLTVTTPDRRIRERVAGEPTYTCQLRAFVRAVRSGEPLPTEGEDSVANMRAIDAVYRAAGLEPRRPSA